MLIAAILCTAVALLAVWFLVRRGNVDPKDWAKRHDAGDDSDRPGET